MAHAEPEKSTAAVQTPDDLTLWYDKPATDWETQALPIGNGALGAMVFGGVASEQIQVVAQHLTGAVDRMAILPERTAPAPGATRPSDPRPG
ncbi:glycoside hydrolase N-terminal domain-containing protein [Streptosporangium minutum]|uniref:glycoside hydrolase N-terminal domain-containing protein n=1 Tax=Streptosporangium minutum TaxID=569862 RepID=UPI001F5FFB70|nr:glycoside hydrolase N-terminal domain-containing protein [Streptosporangium minutum]